MKVFLVSKHIGHSRQKKEFEPLIIDHLRRIGESNSCLKVENLLS